MRPQPPQLTISCTSFHSHPTYPTHPLISFFLLLLLCFVLFLFSHIMEPQKHQQQQPNSDDNVNNNNVNGAKGGSFLCRQTSTRWTPTTDQIRILKDLYYNKGVRSPSADEIQRISAKLRHYGKIEGKNVFYWFQNHKARERQKKRFTNDHAYVPPMQQSRTTTTTTAHHVPSNNPTNNWKPDQDYNSFHHTNYSNNITTPGFFPASSSSTGVLTVGQMGNTYGYGSVTIEKGYMDCSGNNGVGGGGNINHNNGSWLGMDPYNPQYSSLFDNRKSMNECPEDEQDQEEEEAEIETLPLFPTHREDINGNFCNIKHNPNFYYSSRWYGASDAHGNAASRASLELSLNSYTGHQYSRD